MVVFNMTRLNHHALDIMNGLLNFEGKARECFWAKLDHWGSRTHHALRC